MNRIEQDLLKDSNILSVFYGGSIGNQNTDLYSDIDLRIVVKDEFYEEYLALIPFIIERKICSPPSGYKLRIWSGSMRF
ncbi:nucleotidyltransferase domain-containing protein [Brevibacillus laterosporus]|uniref:nucleotidyltransferase domain-containing protein n=1 Tax=Brevibacillus laterosporus TaxID=1465 RepID=UPI0034660076